MEQKIIRMSVSTRELGRLLKSVSQLSIRGNADEDILIDFLASFAPVFQGIMQSKKFLRVDDGEDEMFYIFNTQGELNDCLLRFGRGDYTYSDDLEYSIEQISYEDFVQAAGEDFMDFALYHVEGDGSISFEPEYRD